MIFLVTDIDFDFTDDCGSISEEHKKEIYDDVLGEWEADDEEDLTDEILPAQVSALTLLTFATFLNEKTSH